MPTSKKGLVKKIEATDKEKAASTANQAPKYTWHQDDNIPISGMDEDEHH